MEYQSEQQRLQGYASVANSKILTQRSDLEGQDQVLPEMFDWCVRQQTLVVLQSGAIVTCRPSARAVQNCKIVMKEKGLTPGPVLPATTGLVTQLLSVETVAQRPIVLPEAASINLSGQQTFQELLQHALEIEATDIHIEVRDALARIRLRKHGELFLHAEWPSAQVQTLLDKCFRMTTITTQSALFSFEINEEPMTLRCASVPAQNGYDVVLTLFSAANVPSRSLKALGYCPDQVALLEQAVQLPYGAIIIAGPMGSGKTTTLASCMQLLDARRKVLTLETPVEVALPHATQIAADISMTAALQLDPDVIMLGEMQSADSAAGVIRAAMHGHLVFSTISVPSAMGIVSRLLDFGVSSTTLASPGVLQCLVAQRLVPVLCQVCSIAVVDSRRHYRQLARWERCYGKDLKFLRARGVNCEVCQGLGVNGRKVIAEMIWLDDWGRQCIQTRHWSAWQQYLSQNGWRSYADRLSELVIAGQCDPLDAEKYIGPLGGQYAERRFDYHRIVRGAL